jgi:opacity protein-like surface antigen
MRAIMAAAFTAALLCGGVASAQSAGPAADPRAGQNAAVKSPDTAGLPSKGANSFTKKQAEDRIEKAGYSLVKDLDKDKDGLWRGTAMKDGKTVGVSLDFKGNVNAQ